MRILLTGGTGMVGRNILDHAVGKKLSILAPSHGELELKDYSQVKQYIQKEKPDFIIHAAGYVGGIMANMAEPVRFLVDNLDMGRNLVMAAREYGVPRLINLGSSCMYPRDLPHRLSEEMLLTGELEPTNEGYALAKNMVARLCQYISQEESNCQYKTLIPCNLYGIYDKFDPRVSHVLPAIIYKLFLAKSREENSVEVWGNGEAKREFLFARDLADCVLRSLDHFDTMPGVMNVGTGEDFTINEYYQVAADAIGYQGEFHHDLSKPVGMHRKLMSIEKLKGWGWSAKTSLKEGIKATYQHHHPEFTEQLEAATC